MNWSSVSAVASACIALTAVVLNVVLYRMARKAEKEHARQQRMPVLVAFRAFDGPIRVSNVGWGPATNVFFASWEPRTAGWSLPLDAGSGPGEGVWFNPLHLRPIPVGGSETIPAEYSRQKSPGVAAFGISYTDPFGFPYSTKISNEGSVVVQVRVLPAWSHLEIPYPHDLPAWRRWGDSGPATSVTGP
jgi:hypothetical protein